MIPPNHSAARRHIVITGCSTGIGRACALRLANAGFNAIATVRNQADAKSIRDDAGSSDIQTVMLDVTNTDSLQSASRQIVDLTGAEGIYALINNAGICVVGPVECVTLENWRAQFEVNLFGAVAMTQAMLPLLRQYQSHHPNTTSRIININSVCGEVATPVFAAYSASKFALKAMSDCLRLELRSQGIHVCNIMPGTIRSEIWRKEKEGMAEIAKTPLAKTIYEKLVKNVSEYVFRCADTAVPADRVAKAVERALQTRRPKERYRVGWEAHLASCARQLLPERMFHFMLGQTLGIPR